MLLVVKIDLKINWIKCVAQVPGHIVSSLISLTEVYIQENLVMDKTLTPSPWTTQLDDSKMDYT